MLGIDALRDIIECGIIVPVLWTPVIVTGTGTKMPYGTIDHSSVFGRPPLVTGSIFNAS